MTWRDELRIREGRKYWRAMEKRGLVWLQKGSFSDSTDRYIHLTGATYGQAVVCAQALNEKEEVDV